MKWIRNLLKGISFTAAMFVFQACYGTMENYMDGPLVGVTFHITDYQSGQSIPGIKVESRWQDSQNDNNIGWMTSWYEQGYTDSTGSIFLEMNDMGTLLKIRFSDDDSVYTVKDTVISNFYYDTINIVLQKA